MFLGSVYSNSLLPNFGTVRSFFVIDWDGSIHKQGMVGKLIQLLAVQLTTFVRGVWSGAVIVTLIQNGKLKVVLLHIKR